MKSIAETFLDGFGITPKFRPADLHPIMVSLIATLATGGSLEDAKKLAEKNTGIVYQGSISPIKQLSKHSDLLFLYDHPMTISLILFATPHLGTDDDYCSEHDLPKELSPADRDGNYQRVPRRVLKKAVAHLNSLDLGFRLYTPYRDPGKICIIQYTSHEELMKTVQRLSLPPQIIELIIP